MNLKIGGPGVIVEIDESKFGKRKYNRGHYIEGAWVFGMVERTLERRCFFQVIENRSKETLTEILKNKVYSSSIIFSDCWKAYSDLKIHFLAHETVNHSLYFVDPDTSVHTNTIESNWNALKRTIPAKYRHKRYITPYLIRFMLIRNYNFSSVSALINFIL